MKSEWDEYATNWDTNPLVVEYSKKAFNSLLEFVNIEDLNILDFGCGTGLLTELMQPKAKRIVALDSSAAMITVLKKKKLPRIDAIEALLTRDLIQTNTSMANKFDLIVASSVCGFLPNYKQTLKLLKSTLSTNGLFVQWDWLADHDGSETGLTENEIKSAFSENEMKLLSLTIPFSMKHENSEMSVLMAVGKAL